MSKRNLRGEHARPAEAFQESAELAEQIEQRLWRQVVEIQEIAGALHDESEGIAQEVLQILKALEVARSTVAALAVE